MMDDKKRMAKGIKLNASQLPLKKTGDFVLGADSRKVLSGKILDNLHNRSNAGYFSSSFGSEYKSWSVSREFERPSSAAEADAQMKMIEGASPDGALQNDNYDPFYIAEPNRVQDVDPFFMGSGSEAGVEHSSVESEVASFSEQSEFQANEHVRTSSNEQARTSSNEQARTSPHEQAQTSPHEQVRTSPSEQFQSNPQERNEWNAPGEPSRQSTQRSEWSKDIQSEQWGEWSHESQAVPGSGSDTIKLPPSEVAQLRAAHEQPSQNSSQPSEPSPWGAPVFETGAPAVIKHSENSQVVAPNTTPVPAESTTVSPWSGPVVDTQPPADEARTISPVGDSPADSDPNAGWAFIDDIPASDFGDGDTGAGSASLPVSPQNPLSVPSPHAEVPPQNPPSVPSSPTELPPQNLPSVPSPHAEVPPQNPPSVASPRAEVPPQNLPSVPSSHAEVPPQNPPSVPSSPTELPPQNLPSVPSPHAEVPPQNPSSVPSPHSEVPPQKQPSLPNADAKFSSQDPPVVQPSPRMDSTVQSGSSTQRAENIDSQLLPSWMSDLPEAEATAAASDVSSAPLAEPQSPELSAIKGESETFLNSIPNEEFMIDNDTLRNLFKSLVEPKVTPKTLKPASKKTAEQAIAAAARILSSEVEIDLIPVEEIETDAVMKLDAAAKMQQQADAAKSDSAQSAAPKSDAQQSDAPKSAAPESDAPKSDAQQSDAPKSAAPESDASAPMVTRTERGTIELAMHANGRRLIPQYNPIGMLIRVESSDGFVLHLTEKKDVWEMVDASGRTIQTGISAVAFDKLGNLSYNTKNGDTIIWKTDGTIETKFKSKTASASTAQVQPSEPELMKPVSEMSADAVAVQDDRVSINEREPSAQAEKSSADVQETTASSGTSAANEHPSTGADSEAAADKQPPAIPNAEAITEEQPPAIPDSEAVTNEGSSTILDSEAVTNEGSSTILDSGAVTKEQPSAMPDAEVSAPEQLPAVAQDVADSLEPESKAPDSNSKQATKPDKSSNKSKSKSAGKSKPKKKRR
ncbi:MAG TPA: hypothetical protein V6C76_10410 [Drouetiella sp.]